MAAKRAQYHLDEPFIVQYLLSMKDIITGHFGTTFDGRDIAQQLELRIPVTLKLANLFQWSAGMRVMRSSVSTSSRTRWPRCWQ